MLGVKWSVVQWHVALRQFDRKFGPDLMRELPDTPGVYLFRDEASNVLYVGKAKNIRRRLSNYRNASRRKAHRKMRALVKEASSLEVRLQDSEKAALTLENELIQTLKPPFNVEGTYTFLYPALGLGGDHKRMLLCFTTSPDAWKGFDLHFYGTFRSRIRAKEAFDSLVELLGLVGHIERTASLGPVPSTPGSRLVGIRQLDAAMLESLHGLLSGRTPSSLGLLARRLLDKPRARRDAADVQRRLSVLEHFYQADLKPLHDALRHGGKRGTFVAQSRRDRLFISAG